MSGDDQLNNFLLRGRNAQRAVDSVIAAHNSARKREKRKQGSRPDRPLKKRKLKNGLDVHWRTDADGYESMMRQIFDENKGRLIDISEAERKRWFKRGWQDRLEERRRNHRFAGLADAIFIHPSLKK